MAVLARALVRLLPHQRRAQLRPAQAAGASLAVDRRGNLAGQSAGQRWRPPAVDRRESCGWQSSTVVQRQLPRSDRGTDRSGRRDHRDRRYRGRISRYRRDRRNHPANLSPGELRPLLAACLSAQAV